MSWLVISTFILLFITKLRFPKHKSFTEILNNRYGNTSIGIYRRLEKLHYRLNKAKLDLEFLCKCKTYNTIPKFLHFKLHDPNIRKTKTYSACQFKLLNLEINNKNTLIKQHTKEFDQAYLELKNTLSYLDFKCLYTRLKRSNDIKLKQDKLTHDKKLQNLGIPNNHNHNKEKTVINLSSKTLNDSELEALSLGLSFALPKRNIKFVDHFLAFENLVNNLKYLQCKAKDWGGMIKEITSVAHSSFRDFNIFKRSFPKLPQTLYDSLIKLKSDKSIIITRPDKGRGTVVMNRVDYIKKK